MQIAVLMLLNSPIIEDQLHVMGTLEPHNQKIEERLHVVVVLIYQAFNAISANRWVTTQVAARMNVPQKVMIVDLVVTIAIEEEEIVLI